MGGQNAALVLADADVASAAAVIAAASMGYAGQKCTATSRIVCEAAVASDLREAIVAAVERMHVPDPSQADCQVGPVITGSARQRRSMRWSGRGRRAAGC